MPTLKLIHTADVHISKNGDEGFRALAEVLKKARGEKAQALFITGDLFESDKSAFEVRAKLRELFESYAEIKVFMTSGNHDEGAYEKNINYGSNVVILSEKPYETNDSIEGLTLYAIPFQRNSNIASTLKSISKEAQSKKTFPVLLTHGTLIDQWLKEILVYLSQYESDNESFYIHSQDLEKSGVPLVLLGHYHDHVEKKYGKTLVTYAGSPIPTSIKSSGKRRASLISLDTSKRSSLIEPLILSSAFNTTQDFKAVPSKENELMDDLENFLDKNRDKNAILDAKITGYISTDETEFGKNLARLSRKFEKHYKKLSLKNKSRQVSSIKSEPLVEEFLKLWEAEYESVKKGRANPEVYHKALEFALEAFEESVLKKRNQR